MGDFPNKFNVRKHRAIAVIEERMYFFICNNRALSTY